MKVESNLKLNATRHNSESTTKLRLDETIDQTPTKIDKSHPKKLAGIQTDGKK